MARRAFTLLELLIFSAIFSLAIGGFITMFIAVTRVQSRQASASEVQSQGQYLMQQIQYYVQNGRLLDMTLDAATTTLTIRPTTIGVNDPVTIYANSQSNGTAILQTGTGTLTSLTSNKVGVSNLTFTRHTNGAGSSTPSQTDTVSYSFTMSANNTNGTQAYSQYFQSAASVLQPVPKIALLQNASSSNGGGGGVKSISSTFPGNVTKNNLLIAVVGGVSGAGTSVSDTIANSWQTVGITGGLGKAITIFYAVNGTSSSDRVSASFSSSQTPSLYIYEYRGASTSSVLDAYSQLGNLSTQTPTTSVSPASSTAELIFAALMASSSIYETPAPQTGCTLLNLSSISSVFVEDCGNVYTTGRIQTGFVFSATTPSSSMTQALFR